MLRVAVEYLLVHIEPVAPAGQLVEVALLITLVVVVEDIRIAALVVVCIDITAQQTYAQRIVIQMLFAVVDIAIVYESLLEGLIHSGRDVVQLGIAILIGRFGYKAHLVSYTTNSANLMLREFGLALFLASVGIKAGATFWQTVTEGDGLTYVWAGFLITVIPILIIGVLGRLRYKMNYFTLMGLIAGANTDPPALAYANQTANNDAPAVGYSTVYPLCMFLRILTAQLIILLLYSVM